MKRKAFFVGFFLSLVIQAPAQVGNEWIDFNQLYFKIPVAENGIYALTFSDLQAAGFPVNSVDPRYIQLFQRGKEQAIFIEGESDGQFNTSDFIEFFGHKNDGSSDGELYKPSSLQPHIYYNLFSDTTSYFLTIGTSPGKRMPFFGESHDGSLPAKNFHLEENLLLLTNQYSAGMGFNSEFFTSSFDLGEGFTGVQINLNQQVDYTLENITRGVSTGGQPHLEVLLVGRGDMAHKAEIYAGTSFRLLATVTFTGHETFKYTANIEWSDISGDGKLPVRVRTIGNGGPDRLSVSYIKLNYQQQFNASGVNRKVFTLPETTESKAYIQIENPGAGLRLFDITDPDNVSRIGASLSATLNAVIPAENTSRKIFAHREPLVPAKIKRVTFRQIIPNEHNYIIISHPLLRKPALGYQDPVRAYASYRSSPEGGNYDTLLVNIQQVYDQFNYGETSPLAVFHFLKFLSTTRPPAYLFLIGKGLQVNYNYHRASNQSAWAYKDLIPPAGFPGSDMYYSAGLGETQHEPAVPTGRLTAMKPQQVAAYLDKIKEMEALPFDALWRKDILHLSGGVEEWEPEAFKAYLKGFQAIAEQPYFGGKVSAIAKSSRDIQLVNIAEHINKGVNLVTFFGHSSAVTLDFDIGFVTDPVMGYNNTAKYPMLLMNGCDAGAFFLTSMLFGEDWVLAEKKGAAAFIAHTAWGLSSALRLYSSTLYEVAYGDSLYIHTGIGDIQKETARRYMEKTFPFPIHLSQIQQMILLGDPAVKLFGAPKPDLEIKSNNVSVVPFQGKTVTALADSFALNLVVRNFGVVNPGPVRVEVERTLNDNSVLMYDSLFEMPRYADTLMFIIRRRNEKGSGNNTFKITIDPDDFVEEITKENNIAVVDVTIPLNGTKNIFPFNFAIVSKKTVDLSFQTTDLYSPEREFLLEIDTVHTFDSEYKKEVKVSGNVLAKYSLELLDTDSLVYYWRTKLAQPLSGESEAWDVHSFTYINSDVEGWAQVHFPQYLENETVGLVKDAVLRKLDFHQSVTPVFVQTYGSASGLPLDSVSVKIDGQEYNLYAHGFGCRNNTLNLIAFDRRSTGPYAGVEFTWYNRAGRACGRVPWVINSFIPAEMITGNNDDIVAFVDNVTAGDSVVLFNIGDANYSSWPAQAKTKLGELGISEAQIEGLATGAPVVIFGRKGTAPGSAKVFTASNGLPDVSRVKVNETITGGYVEGTMSSGWIGPAQHWQSFLLQVKETEPEDDVRFNVTGYDLAGQAEILFENVQNNLDLSTIDASRYPYLKITFTTADDTHLTPAQLKKWLVLYTPVAEGILLPVGNNQPKTVYEGQIFEEHYKFVNISEKTFLDSLSVKLEVFNQRKRESRIQFQKIKAPAPNDTTRFSIRFATQAFAGLNDHDVYVNPKILPELYYDNNRIVLNSYLYVVKDDFNPVLDVTIDGRYVQQNDFVSANPFIQVKLWDENRYLLKTDTTGVRIFLTYPCASENCPPDYIKLSGDHVRWFPATEESDFRVEFTPENLPDGTYVLRVEGRDTQGNASGVEPYQVSFQVNSESGIQFLFPHPNPMSTDIYFGFVATGTSAPDAYTLHISDVTGKRVFSQTPASSQLVVGTNLIHWKGRDNQNNLLPAGLYIYLLQIVKDKKEFRRQGKVVIHR